MQDKLQNDMEQFGQIKDAELGAQLQPNWEAFLPILDEAMPIRKRRVGWLAYTAVAALFIICIGGYVVWYSTNSSKLANAMLFTSKGERQHVNKIPLSSIPAEAKQSNLLKESIKLDLKSATTTNEQKLIVQSKSSLNEDKLVNKVKNKTTFKKQFTVANVTNNYNDDKDENLVNKLSSVTNTQNEFSGINVAENENLNSHPIHLLSNGEIVNIESFLNRNEIVNTIEPTFDSTKFSLLANSFMKADLKRLIKVPKNNKLYFSIEPSFTTDISTVNFYYLRKISHGRGVTVGVHFNKKWSVHIGALYTKKMYKVDGDDFYPPKNAWINNYKMQNVSGWCAMWEVPLNVRYYVSTKNKLFVSTGLSNYLMKKEYYNYLYYNQGNLSNKSYFSRKGRDYLFSILNLSVGKDFKVLPQVNVHIEPFARIPFHGLGFGAIKLSSFGVNTAIQLKLNSKPQMTKQY